MTRRLSTEQMREAFEIGLKRSASLDAEAGYSAIAEFAVAHELMRHWTGARPNDGVTVEGNVGVRWTASMNGSLIAHEDEPPDRIRVLVVGIPPHHRVVGWISVADAFELGQWRTDVEHPAYFVDQQHLKPMSTLPPA